MHKNRLIKKQLLIKAHRLTIDLTFIKKRTQHVEFNVYNVTRTTVSDIIGLDQDALAYSFQTFQLQLIVYFQLRKYEIENYHKIRRQVQQQIHLVLLVQFDSKYYLIANHKQQIIPTYYSYLYQQYFYQLSKDMFHLPNEEALRWKINYTQQFALTLLWNVGVAGIIVTSLFLIFFILKKYQLRVARNESMRQSILTQEENSSRQLRQSGRPNTQLEIYPRTISFKIINLLTSLFFYLFWIIATLLYLVFFMFGYFGRGTHIDVLSVSVLAVGLIVPTILWKNQTKVTSWEKLKGQSIFTIIMLVLWLGLSIFLVIATKGICVCYFNSQHGISVTKDAKATSQFYRGIYIDPPCPAKSICHLYATLPEEASTSVFFNAHSGIDIQSLSFSLKLNNVSIVTKDSKSPLKMDNVESMGQRYVHSVIFTGLTADTKYSIEVKDKDGVILKQANYKTLPNQDTSQLKMAIGGDLGMTQQGIKITSFLSDFKPDVIVLGGDTTYDDGMRSCYHTWDQFYRMFEPIYDKLDRIIPIIMSVGNHDVGFDALSQSIISRDPQQIPLFFYYNPQHLSKNNEVPTLQERLSYHYHKIGPAIMFNLDSGYITKYNEQTDFIKNISTNNPNLYRFANYHNPIYPTCTSRNPDSLDKYSIQEGLKYWTPLFDQFNFVASMEHHTHYRKFTYKIQNNTINNVAGTRYIGDGSWGVTQDTCPAEKYTTQPELIEKYGNQKANHMWQISLKKIDPLSKNYQINYTAIDLQGTIVTQKIEDLPLIQ